MNRSGMSSAVLAASLVLLPCLAWAEVMDKEPTLVTLWTRALVLGAIGYLAWRLHWIAGVVAAMAAALVVFSFQLELADTYVGPAIRLEAGRGYVTQAYGSMLACAALQAAGLVSFIRRRKARESAPSPEGAGQRTTR